MAVVKTPELFMVSLEQTRPFGDFRIIPSPGALIKSLPELFTENWALGPTCNDSFGKLTEPMPSFPPLVRINTA